MSEIPNLLNYGFLGLSALILFLFWRVISEEQKRDGQPRKGIIRLSWSFIFLAFALSTASMVLELIDAPKNKRAKEILKQKLSDAQIRERKCNEKAVRLDERTTAQIDLIKRLDSEIGNLRKTAESIRSSGITQVRVTIPGSFMEGSRTQLRPGNFWLPENDEIKYEIARKTNEILAELRQELKKVEQIAPADLPGSAALRPATR
jgi:heme exporter protein D